MIARVEGNLTKRTDMSVIIDVQGISYEILVPVAVMAEINKEVGPDGFVRMVTYHYYQMEHTRIVPMLIGFLNEIERDFFILFTTVSGVGPKAAVKALSKPISVIAQAIDRGDKAFLKSLPGVGEQKARDIIAKLGGKVGKFALMQTDEDRPSTVAPVDIQEEALEVLLQLEYKKAEAEAMIKRACERNNDVSSAEEILNEVYKQKMMVT